MAPFRHRASRSLAAALGFALLALAACSHPQPAPVEVPASALQAFRRGVDAYREEDYARAARLFELAAVKDDRNATIQYNLGLAYYMLEAYPESIAAYQKCLKLDPTFADAHMNLALAYDRTYDLDQANAHYNAYLALVRAKPLNGSATPAADGAKHGAGQALGESGQGVPGARKANGRPPVLGGEPISSLPGGNLARFKGDPRAASGSHGGQPAAGQPFAGGREPPGAAPSQLSEPAEPAERLREAQKQSSREAQKQRGREAQSAPSDSGQPTFSSADPWWTQETLPKTP
ncbi:MAG: tetratricopeptide repeat protein [SAR324 cluster bacterium]